MEKKFDFDLSDAVEERVFSWAEGDIETIEDWKVSHRIESQDDDWEEPTNPS